ncbi:ribonuclease Z [Candidatus Bathyarchaeota archaeon]|nr:ribonuclease Z [Candidatus Bathyarchaeota archaeon]
MSLRVIFLGTGGSVPTVERSLPAMLVQRQGEQLMFDCGEGVQRQMVKAKVGFHRKTKIFVSHMHGDHVLGLPGLLQTMALLNRQKKLEIYGPEGIKQFLESVRESLQFGLTFPVEIHEVYDAGVVCEEKDYIVEVVWSNHVVSGLAYAFVEKLRPGKFYPEKAKILDVPEGELWSKLQHGSEIKLADGRVVRPENVMGLPRKGRKIVYSGDTRPFEDFVKFAAGADLIVHEATFDDSLSEKAEVDGHSTPSQAGQQAKKAMAKKLVLTHISARYADAGLLLEQAQKVFKETLVAEDFMVLELPISDI